MSDKHALANESTRANESMRPDDRAIANNDFRLYFDKRPNPYLIAYSTPIDVGRFDRLAVLSPLYVHPFRLTNVRGKVVRDT